MFKTRLFLSVLIASTITNVSAQTYSFEDAITATPAPSPSIVISNMDSDSHDSDDYEDHELVDLSLSANISTLESTYTNWVGPGFGAGVDTACYRESHVADVCPVGFEYKLGSCWAQCPLEYPVECGMQCIRQNDDCTLEMLSKVSSVAQSALSIATFGAYEAFSKTSEGVQIALQCVKEVANLVKALTKHVRIVQVTDPQTTTDQLLTKLYQTDNVVYDLPITIMSCLGIKVSKGMKVSDRVTNTIELFVKEVIANKDAIASSWESFTTFMKNITLGGTIEELNATNITSLQSALESNSTCGEDMKRLTDPVWLTIATLRIENPAISEAEVRVKMYESNLLLYEIPTVTNNCMEQLVAESDETTAYTTRDTLRKTFGGIVDDHISSGTSDNGTFLSAEEYAYSTFFVAVWDPTNIAGVVSEFFQSIRSS